MRLRRRALRLHDRGEAVARLQQALKELGYDVGEEDGVFGYLTRDALCRFQREHRLTVDGKAGPDVFAALFRPELRALRTTHVVRAGERLVDIAREHGVSEEYLRRTNRLSKRSPVYEGRHLVIRTRYVIGAARSLDPREVRFILRRAGGCLSALGVAAFRLAPDGSVDGTWSADTLRVCDEVGVEVLAVVHTGGGDGRSHGNALHSVLRRRTPRRRALDACRSLGAYAGVAGVVLDGTGLVLGDGSRFVRFAEDLAAPLRAEGRKLFAAVPPPAPGLARRLAAADIDWRRLERAADGIVLQTHMCPPRGGGFTPEQLRYAVKAACRQVPSWKLLLGMYTGAREEDERGVCIRELSYQQGLALAYRHRVRPAWDQAWQVLTAEYAASEPESGRRTLRLADARSAVAGLRLVDAYNLQGLFLWPLGSEDTRLWEQFPHWIKAWRHGRRTGHI